MLLIAILLIVGLAIIKVTGNATISSPMSIFGDLEINPGSTLTINSEVHFSEFSSIIVHSGAKLIVDGGKLTNDCKKYVGRYRGRRRQW